MADNTIRLEYTSIAGPKHNGRVEQKLARMTAFLEFPAEGLDHGLT